MLLSTGTCGLATPLAAQGAPTSGDEIRRKLEAQQNELQAKKARENELSKAVSEIDVERERLNARLLETAALIQKSEGKMSSIESRLGELEAQEKLVRGSLDQRHGQISKLLGALQRMGRNPPPVMITQRADALEMVRSAMLLAAAFPELRGQALQLSSRLQELVRVMDDIRTESARLKSETERLSDAQTKLAGLMEERKQSLAQRKSELQDVRRAATDISKSVTDLNELIARLDKAVTEKTGLSDYDREARAAEAASEAAAAASAQPLAPAASPPATASPNGPIVVMPQQSVAGEPGALPPVAGPPPGAPAVSTKVAAITVPKPSEFIELRPGNGMRADTGRIKPAIPFHLARGKLPMPAHGQRVLNFGEKTKYGHPSKGIVIETRNGAQITSPADGWIIYAGEFRSYGQLLIINAGGGYLILLAGLSRIDVEPGQFVLAAEPVGTMAGSTSGGSGSVREVKNETNTPVLYVELRKDGRPIDPSPWWASGPDKVKE